MSRSAASNVIELPLRQRDGERGALEREVVLALATADDLSSAMDRVVESVLRRSAFNRVEWWTTAEDGTPRLSAAIGIARGSRHELPLGGAGTLVLHGASLRPEIASALTTAAPIIQRRAAEERLAQTAIELAQRSQALEDFAALVAHELKTPLQAALVADDPLRSVEDALDLVETLLAAAQVESGGRASASAAESLDQAVADLRTDVEITADLASLLPLPAGALRVILRNLLANAVAAGARHIHVAAERSAGLYVDDDGIGLAEVDRYAAGSGLGLWLSGRIASRFGGVIELTPRDSGGTRATLAFPEAAR